MYMDLYLEFLRDMTFANAAKIFFTWAWVYGAPFIGGFTKMNSYHMYRTYKDEFDQVNMTVNSIY